MPTVIPNLRWTIEVARQEAFDIALNRGETVSLEPRFYLRGSPMDFPADSTVTLYYRSGDMAAGVYHELSGTHHADDGRVVLPWTPDEDGGAGIYSYTLVIADTDEAALVRASGSISIADNVFASGTAPATVTTHSARTDNPHSVTKTQVGLGNVDNTADANKPVSTAQQAALDDKADDDLGNVDPATGRTALSVESTTELNTRDTANRARGNHTGEQAISTVTGLQTALDGKTEEAPEDGAAYARKDGNWEAVPGASAVASDLTDHENETTGAHGGIVASDDPQLSDAREWTAATVGQPEAEGGSATTRRAWTSQRVRQAIAAWWATITNVIKTDPATGDQTIAVDEDAAFGNTLTMEGRGVFQRLDAIDSATLGQSEAVFEHRRKRLTDGAVVTKWQVGIRRDGQSPENDAWILVRASDGAPAAWAAISDLCLHVSNDLEMENLTPSLPLALDADKRAVTLSAADFRTLIGLVIGTDVLAPDGDADGLTNLRADELTGQVAIANGGTGATTAQGARENLGAAKKIGTREVTAETDTLALTDNEQIVKCNRSTAQTITIPPQSSVAWVADAVVNLVKKGAGDVTIQGGTGVTVNGVSEGGVTISTQFQGATCLRDAEDVWIISGAI